MEERTSTFGALLRSFRIITKDSKIKRTSFLTQERFAEILQEELGEYGNLAKKRAMIANWEKNLYLPGRKERLTQLTIVKILKDYGGILYREEADSLLMAGNYSPLTNTEAAKIHLTSKNPKHTSEQIWSNFSLLPSYPIDKFVGRKADIRKIESSLTIDQIAIIQGLPGVGKSSILKYLAHRQAQNNIIILFGSIGPEGNPLDTLIAWGSKLGIHDMILTATIEKAKERLTATIQNKPLIMIVDDIWTEEQARAFINLGGRNSSIVISTRSREIANFLCPIDKKPFTLKVMSPKDALRLFEYIAPSFYRKFPTHSKDLVSELEFLPLSIRVVGKTLEAEIEAGINPLKALAELQEGKLLEKSAPADMSNKTITVQQVLEYSTNRLDETTLEQFARLGSLVAKPNTFDTEDIAGIWEVKDPTLGIRTLINRGLLERVSESRYQMHHLLLMHARSMLV